MGMGGVALIMLLGLAVATGAGIVAICALIGRRTAPPGWALPYECGVDPVDRPRGRVTAKYFLVVLLFIVFDAGLLFLSPWALIFREAAARGMGAFVFAEMGIFLGLFVLALAYAWGRGALEWER